MLEVCAARLRRGCSGATAVRQRALTAARWPGQGGGGQLDDVVATVQRALAWVATPEAVVRCSHAAGKGFFGAPPGPEVCIAVDASAICTPTWVLSW